MISSFKEFFGGAENKHLVIIYRIRSESIVTHKMLWTLKNKKLILVLGSVTVAFKKTWHLSCSDDETGILDI